MHNNAPKASFTLETCTDLFCTVFTTIFAVTIFIASIILLDAEKLRIITYPTDGVGHKCTLDNPNYNYLYFTSFNDPVHVSSYLRLKDYVLLSAQKEMKKN